MKVKIIDNFLDQNTFENIHNEIMGGEFPWYFNESIDFLSGEGERFQFIHAFYIDVSEGYQVVHSASFKFLIPIIEKLKSKILLRVKANLLTQTPNIIENKFHIDRGPPQGREVLSLRDVERLKPYTTSILYMNTNNGYTKFEDGTTVKSKANRMATFPASLRHLGTTCTDEKIRVVINFNYLK